jgi:glycolate oxidase iron-sulfur subunit
VAFFGGCVAQVTFSTLNEATIRVLRANGCEVVVPEKQVCCGALASHAGVREAARELARKNLQAFPSGDFDAIVTNAAGCGSTLKEYSHLFTADEPLGMVARLKPNSTRATYQDSCHLLHGQKVREAPRALLRAIPGLELIELPYSDICCGSAGVYNITQTEASLELLAEKMKHAASTKAQTIVTANPGCLLQMRAGADLHKTGQQVLHVMELLDRSLE